MEESQLTDDIALVYIGIDVGGEKNRRGRLVDRRKA